MHYAIQEQFETSEKQYSQCSLIQALQTENAELREKLTKEEMKNEKLEIVGADCVTELVKKKRVMTIPTIYEGWVLKIDVKPLWESTRLEHAIDFTASGNVDQKPGSRIPAIWVKPNSLALTFFNFVNGNGNHAHRGVAVKLNEWTSIKLSTLKRFNETYKYTIDVNGVEVYSVINKSVKVWNNVKVYHLNGPYGVPPYLIKNFEFETNPEL